MKQLILIVILSVLLISCKSKQPITEVPIRTVEKVTERLVEVQLPADSTWLTAYLECDSTNQVILRGINEQKSSGVFSDLMFRHGVLNYRTKTNPEPQKAVVKDSIVYREIPIKVEVPVVEYRQTKWQSFTSVLGTITLIILSLYTGWKILKKTLIK